MITRAIQEDYGGFDPKFMGITVRFDARYPKGWQLFKQTCSKDRDPNHVIELGNNVLQCSPGEAFELFSIGTAIVHEMRHFHDFILSPFGNHVFRLRVNATANGVKAIAPVLKRKGILPVPIPVWRRKSLTERAELISQWQSLLEGQSKEVLEIPDDRQALVEQTESAYEKIRDLLVNPQATSLKIPLQPYHLFEASAIIAQIQHVYSVFGTKHAELFMNLLLSDPGTRSYALVFRLLSELWHTAGLPADTAKMSAAITWSILGDYSVDLWEACPTVRFNRLFDLLAKDGPPSQSENTQDLFEKWSAKLGVSSISESLQKQVEANKRVAAKLENELKDLKDLLGEIIDITQTFYRVSDHMSKLFLENPETYVYPYFYQTEEIAQKWVAAPIRVTFTGGGIVGTKKEFGDLDIRKALPLDDERLVVITLGWGQSMGIKMVNLTEALNACDTMTMLALCFDQFRHEPDFEIVRQVWESEGILPFEILF